MSSTGQPLNKIGACPVKGPARQPSRGSDTPTGAAPYHELRDTALAETEGQRALLVREAERRLLLGQGLSHTMGSALWVERARLLQMVSAHDELSTRRRSQ